MSGTITPPKIATETLIINNYRYTLSNIIPHTSVNYAICCYNDLLCVKVIQGLLEGEQYNEWTTDDWMDRFIKEKIETLPELHVEETETPLEETVETVLELPLEETVETPVQETTVEPEIVESETPVEETPVVSETLVESEVPVQETHV